MSQRPDVLLSCVMSVDGYIDDNADQRLLLSNPADFDRVDAMRATCDAILIGATTLRRDNPRLLVDSEERRARRQALGLPRYPLKVALTRSGDLDPGLRFWHCGGDKVVYCPELVAGKTRERLAGLTDVVGLGAADPGEDLDLPAVLEDLGRRGVRRLMVEGGGTIHTQFLLAGLADEIHLALAPFFVGDPGAPRFVNPGRFPQDPLHRMRLAEVRALGDIAVLRYLPQTPRTSRTTRSRPDSTGPNV
jgi:5-amino-6-(5-phosphoribosylamino)uracil reductase